MLNRFQRLSSQQKLFYRDSLKSFKMEQKGRLNS